MAQFSGRSTTNVMMLDDVALAYANIAELEAWKNHQLLNNALSIQDLVRRADRIEATLRRQTRSPLQTSTPHRTASHSSNSSTRGSPTVVPSQPSIPEGYPSLPPSVAGSADMRSRICSIFRHGALVYLLTVINGHHPSKSDDFHEISDF
jgi:hypothetical protein